MPEQQRPQSRGTSPLKTGELNQQQELARMEAQIKEATLELKHRMEYLDSLARQNQVELEQLKKAQPQTPQIQQKIARMEQKMAAYRAVKAAVGTADQLNSSPELLKQTGTLSIKNALSLKLAEAEATVANGRLLVDDASRPIKVLETALGVAGKQALSKYAFPLNAADAAIAQRLKGRAGDPATAQHMRRALQIFGDVSAAVEANEAQLAKVRQMQGKEAYDFLVNEMKVPQLAGKLYYLQNLHGTFGTDADLRALFPAPEDIKFPVRARTSGPLPTDQQANKPITDRLKGIFGLQQK